MTARTIIGIASLLCVSICGLVATFASFEMVDKVNEKLPENEQFDWLGWYTEKTLRLHREYKRIYPDGRLLFKLRVLTALGFASLLICAWGFKVFAR